jgi:prevent-host-death family protein
MNLAMKQVNILEAKNQLSKLIKAAQAGEEVIIANRGKPVVRLVVAETPVTPERGSPQAFIAWLDARPPLPPESRRTAAEIDAGIAEERAAWD